MPMATLVASVRRQGGLGAGKLRQFTRRSVRVRCAWPRLRRDEVRTGRALGPSGRAGGRMRTRTGVPPCSRIKFLSIRGSYAKASGPKGSAACRDDGRGERGGSGPATWRVPISPVRTCGKPIWATPGQPTPRSVRRILADLRGADLSTADLREARLEGARASARTLWPAGIDASQAGVTMAEDREDEDPSFALSGFALRTDLPPLRSYP
jgi:hypothetical protein